MTEPTIFDRFAGLDFFAMILGFLGAILGVSFSEPMSKKQMFAALVSGILAAGFGPQTVTYFVQLQYPGFSPPVAVQNVTALFMGVGGMFIVPGVIAFWKGFRDNPWGFIDRIRGRVPTSVEPPSGDAK